MIRLFKVAMSQQAKEAAGIVLDSGYIGQGVTVDIFEKELQTALGFKVLTTNSCTSAIDLALHLCGVGPGDEVLTTAMTCTATNTMVVNRGARIVWCDVEALTGCINPNDVARKVTKKTKAIIAVDWGGRLCEFGDLKRHGVPVIEDAAHCFGRANAPLKRGDYIALSFQAIKFLTTGDGGALHVPDDQVDRARLLRWYGLDRRSDESFRCQQTITEAGYKYHMNDIAASIGLANIPTALKNVVKQQENANRYYRRFEHLLGVVTPPPYYNSSVWLYTILVNDRDGFIERMKVKGVECSPVHVRNDKHPAFRGYVGDGLPGLDYFAAHEVAIPVGWWLSDEDIETVGNAVEECVK